MAELTRRSNTLLVILALLDVFCEGQQLHFKHAPPYIAFQQQSPDAALTSCKLHDVLAAPLGLHSEPTNLIQSKSVLKRPKASVLITVVTQKNQDMPVESLASLPLDCGVPFEDVDQLMNNIQRKFVDKTPVMLDFVSTNQFFDIKTSSSIFDYLTFSFASAKERLLDPDSFLSRLAPTFSLSGTTSLNSSLNSDGGLLAELQMVDDVISTLKVKAEQLNTKTPDFLSFTLTGLESVGKAHGVDSDQARDAEEIITKFINQITEDLKFLYKGNVMVGVLTVPSIERAKIRKTRSLMQAPKATNDFSKLNLEIDYHWDFPASFNIILWLMIILMITVFVVAYGIWHLNPNLESILYRVPQEDLKKIN